MLRQLATQRLLSSCLRSSAAACSRLCVYRSLSSAVAAAAAGDGSSSAPVHVPVLLHETIAFWSDTNASSAKDADTARYFVDGTAGFGGHSRALLERCTDARLLCIDRDSEVLAIAKANLRDFGNRVAFQQGSYVDVSQHLAAAGFPSRVDGILVDLGANSFHFDQPHRGFSWMHDGPLDMRFDQQSGAPTAADVLNTHSEVQLTKIFRDFGEEKLAKEYAKAVVRDRDEKKLVFKTTQDLKECIERIARRWQRDSSSSNTSNSSKGGAKKKAKAGKDQTGKAGKTTTHPATRCFQALRIYVNEELQHVEDGIHQLVDHLAPGGRLVTIAFHSLEDRPIKTLFRKLDKQGRIDEDEDVDDEFADIYEVDEEYDDEDDDEDFESEDDDEEAAEKKRFRLAKRKATKPTREEMAMNPRSRSARLRCLERIV